MMNRAAVQSRGALLRVGPHTPQSGADSMHRTHITVCVFGSFQASLVGVVRCGCSPARLPMPDPLSLMNGALPAPWHPCPTLLQHGGAGSRTTYRRTANRLDCLIVALTVGGFERAFQRCHDA